MKKTIFYLTLFLMSISVMSCTPSARYADPFYNINYDDLPLRHLPLIKPIEAKQRSLSSPWRVFLPYGLWVSVPDSQEEYAYNIEELEKFAVNDGVIMAYSAYVDKEANVYIQDNYYHWFVLIPAKEIAEGFHTENEFLQYVQTLDIQDPDWQTPDEAYEHFTQTGCLDWVPDCK